MAISYHRKKSISFRICLKFNVREKIRTPDLLVRSQTLYPAELRAHYCVPFLLCPSQQNLLYRRSPWLSTSFFKFFQLFQTFFTGIFPLFFLSSTFATIVIANAHPIAAIIATANAGPFPSFAINGASTAGT